MEESLQDQVLRKQIQFILQWRRRIQMCSDVIKAVFVAWRKLFSWQGVSGRGTVAAEDAGSRVKEAAGGSPEPASLFKRPAEVLPEPASGLKGPSRLSPEPASAQGVPARLPPEPANYEKSPVALSPAPAGGPPVVS
jgi:hypothetical protein